VAQIVLSVGCFFFTCTSSTGRAFMTPIAGNRFSFPSRESWWTDSIRCSCSSAFFFFFLGAQARPTVPCRVVSRSSPALARRRPEWLFFLPSLGLTLHIPLMFRGISALFTHTDHPFCDPGRPPGSLSHNFPPGFVFSLFLRTELSQDTPPLVCEILPFLHQSEIKTSFRKREFF